MKFLSTLLAFSFAALGTQAQLSFYNANNRLVNADFHSGVALTVVDWNGDGLDDIVRMDEGFIVYVEIQNGSGMFEQRFLGSFGPFSGSNGSAWGMAVADVDGNGFKDILAGGYGPAIKVMMIDDDGLGSTIVSLPGSNYFMQNANFADINNDGWLDVFACNDVGQSKIWLNDGTGAFVSSTIIDFDITPTDDSGNYGSVWTDFDNDGDLDLYIAKCRQGVNDPNDGRRINVLFENNGDGTFTSNATARGIDVGWQSWTANFADIDNDGDLDLLITNHDFQSQIFENDGTGNFTDITASTGFTVSDITPIQSVLEDFDNDGFVDILVTGSSWRFYRNNGDKTFTKINGLFTGNMESFAIGDLNHDGFIDVYGGYASIYTNPTNIDDVVWLNGGNANNFFNLVLQGTVSNSDAVGARAFLYGPWGVQLRENHCGESYGTVNTFHLHFGLGQHTQIDSAVIHWPSGIKQTIAAPSINQFLRVIENDCVSPEAIVTSSGPMAICNGQPAVLSAPAGYQYLWSNGETTQQITVVTAGEYFVQITAPGNNCVAISAAKNIKEDPDVAPVISAAGETFICDGESLTLTAPVGYQSYQWSNGATTQHLTVSQSGWYTVEVMGQCVALTSNGIEVDVLMPALPIAANDTVLAPGASVVLTATGDNITWYNAPAGGTALATGSTFTTPVITSTTTYYVENAVTVPGDIANGGLMVPAGTNQYPGNNTNAKVYFDVLQQSTWVSAKVYTDYPGYRLVEVYTASGVLYDTAYVYAGADSAVLLLNIDLAPGAYYVTTNAQVNQQIPNWNGTGPRFKRNPNGTGVSYPYPVGDMLSITGNDQSASFYYSFYDWLVQKPTVSCPSERVAVEVFYNTDIAVHATQAGFIQLFPNPASQTLNVVPGVSGAWRIALVDALGRVVIDEAFDGGPGLLYIATLPSGVYAVRVTTENGPAVAMLVVQH